MLVAGVTAEAEPDSALALLQPLSGQDLELLAEAALDPEPGAGPPGGLRAQGGRGFGYGRPADRLPPGPVLAGLVERTWDDGLAALGDDELTGVLRAARRLASWAAALELAAASDLMRRREEYAAATGDLRPAEHVYDEIAAALTLTARAADREMDLALSLRRLPGTAAALASGDIDLPRASVIAAETSGLSDEHAVAVEQKVLPEAAGQTTGQLRATLRRAVVGADPAAARARKEQAEREARVERWHEPAGTAALAGRDLPPAAVLAADRNLTALAGQLQAAGIPGTMDNLRAQVYLCLLAGQPLSKLLGTAPDRAGAELGTGIGAETGPGTAGETRAGGDPGTAGRTGAGEGTDAAAGTGAGGGAIGSEAVRGSPGRVAVPWLGPADSLAAADLSMPGLRGTVNLTMPLATWLGQSEAPGSAAGFGPLDASDSRALSAALAGRGNEWCITLTDQQGRAVAHGCSRAGPDPGDQSWTFTIRRLEDGECHHSRQVSRYRPPRSLRHVLGVRHLSCAYPGCRRPAYRCDLDHTQPYDQGGRTCECNLAPLCRRHHKAKQAHGWHLSQPEPGTLVWTTPSGRSYVVRASTYLE